MVSNQEFQTIKTFIYNSEALVYEALLQSEGIEYFLKDANITSSDPMLSNAVGGIKLQVRAIDYEKALALVKRNEKKAKVIVVGNKKFDEIYMDCPNCGKEYCYELRLTILTSIYYSFTKRPHYCAECKHAWKQL